MIVRSLDALERLVQGARSDSLEPVLEPIVVVGGTFRAFHPGHFYLFERARDFASPVGYVIALMNSTKSIQKIKPSANFIMPDEQRKVMALYAGADAVYMFDDETPENVCRAIKPDILVKGGDWEGKNLPEAKYCKEVCIVERIDLSSADAILSKVNLWK